MRREREAGEEVTCMRHWVRWLAGATVAAGLGAAAGSGLAQGGSAVTGIEWTAEDVLGGGVPDSAEVTLMLDGQGRAAGRSGCNRYTGAVEIGDGTMRFGPIAGTRMACPPALMDLEQKVFRALEATRLFVLDASRSKLRLMDEAGQPLLVLAR
jgi:putative lipoprotein